MFGVKGISEGIQVSGKQYTAMFDVWSKTDVEIMFRAFHVYVFCFAEIDETTWLVK
jgi:hypothetical protein